MKNLHTILLFLLLGTGAAAKATNLYSLEHNIEQIIEHQIPNSSIGIVIESCHRYRLPEPVRRAHLLANRARSEM